MEVIERVKQYKQYVIDMRREFHMYPELSWKEFETSKRIKRELDLMGISYLSVADPGIVATIEGAKSGRTIALRADMDALEVTEANETEYKSRNKGISHACGHDAHMAMLLGAAEVLHDMKEELQGTVKLIFQPAEELVSGTKTVIREGGLDRVDSIFGIHINGFLPIGQINAQEGARLSSGDHFEITIKGQGGHGGIPHQGVDAIMAASAVVMNLQSIVSRETDPVDPTVVSVGMFHAGTRNNDCRYC